MCSPVLAVTAIGTAMSMAGQYMQYQQESSAAQASADYNASVAANQAEVNQQLANNALAKGEADRERLLRSGVRHQGEMLSQLGASGFAADSGSALSLLGDSAQEIQYDANIVSHNAGMEAWQHQANANQNLNDQSWFNYQKKTAKGSSTAQWLGMGGSLLGGVASGMGRMK